MFKMVVCKGITRWPVLSLCAVDIEAAADSIALDARIYPNGREVADISGLVQKVGYAPLLQGQRSR